MSNAHSDFWSAVARKYDKVVDLQIGPKTRSLVRDRVRLEGTLGKVVEFGAGTGFYTSVLAGKADSLLATDISSGMLEVARELVQANNVNFQTADCQSTGLPSSSYDTAFISLVIHFTEPARTISEMHRVLRVGGTLIIANLDMPALKGFNRVRCIARMIFEGLTRYRVRPPKGFGATAMSEKNLLDLLNGAGFRVVSSETIRDGSRTSYVPIQYIRASKI